MGTVKNVVTKMLGNKKPTTPTKSIAVSEPNPSTPKPGKTMLQESQARRAARLTALGYKGPMPGSAELKAARAKGEHPILDFRKSLRKTPGTTSTTPTPKPPVLNQSRPSVIDRVNSSLAKVKRVGSSASPTPRPRSSMPSMPAKPAPRPMPSKPMRPNLSRPRPKK